MANSSRQSCVNSWVQIVKQQLLQSARSIPTVIGLAISNCSRQDLRLIRGLVIVWSGWELIVILHRSQSYFQIGCQLFVLWFLRIKPATIWLINGDPV